jgi:hypothetical protein
MSRKYRENIKGSEARGQTRFWSIKRARSAVVEVARGTNSRNIGCFLPIVLGLGSKRAYFMPTRARTRSKAGLALLILLCGGLALGVCQIP